MNENDLTWLAIGLPEDVERARDLGDYERAQRLIKGRLENERTPFVMKKRLSLESEIIRRLPLDYPYTVEEGLEIVRRQIPDFTREELEKLIDDNKADWLYVDGRLRLQRRFFLTLKTVYPDIAVRASASESENGDFNNTPSAHRRKKRISDMKANGSSTAHIRIRSTLRIKEEAFQKGPVTVYLPIPKPQSNMSNIHILSSSPEGVIGSEDQRQRTIVFKENMTENHPFCVEYEYDSYVVYHDLSKPYEPGVSPKPETGVHPEDLEEVWPHIRFTPAVRELCKELVGNETDPLKKARAFYDFVTTKIVYSYMREYFTIEEIPDFAITGLKGDCGVQALTFITLCRCAGIPARWQSGMHVNNAFEGDPAEAGSHDWAMFYVEPWGWLFADCSFGGSAYRAGNSEAWNYYFGNLDVDRMAANDAFQAPLVPRMKFMRSDPYDNQSGEVEYEDHALLRKDVDFTAEVLEHRDI